MKSRVLLFAPRTFGFYRHIIDALASNGYDVEFFDEIFTTKGGLLRKLLLKLPLRVRTLLQKRYVSAVLKTISGKVDYIFIIRGEYFSSDVLLLLEDRFPSSQRIMYQWDSSKNLRFFEDQILWFNRVFTFDNSDADRFGVKHKSLFFNSLHTQSSTGPVKAGKMTFVGTHHSNRFRFIRKFLDENPRLKRNSDIRLFRPITSFLRALVFNRTELEGANISDFVTRPVKELEVLRILSESEFILDITQQDQVGLTIRTFEALGLGRKLITTNPNIKNYQFYDARNIFIVDEYNLRVSDKFLSLPYVPLSDDVLEMYYVNNWVKEFFDDCY